MKQLTRRSPHCVDDCLAKREVGSRENFLMAAKTSDNFVAFMDKEVATVEGRAVVPFTKPITEQSFKEMTVDQEQTVYALWA